MQAAYRGHPQAGLVPPPSMDQGTKNETPAMTREDMARFEDALEGML